MAYFIAGCVFSFAWYLVGIHEAGWACTCFLLTFIICVMTASAHKEIQENDERFSLEELNK